MPEYDDTNDGDALDIQEADGEGLDLKGVSILNIRSDHARLANGRQQHPFTGVHSVISVRFNTRYRLAVSCHAPGLQNAMASNIRFRGA